MCFIHLNYTHNINIFPYPFFQKFMQVSYNPLFFLEKHVLLILCIYVYLYLLDITTVHYLHKDNTKISIYKKTKWTLSLSVQCPFVSSIVCLCSRCLTRASTSMQYYFNFASNIAIRSINISILLPYSTSLRAFSAFNAEISSCITYTEEIGPPL